MSTTVKELIQDAVTKAFVTVNNVFQPKITELEDRYSTGGFYMLGDGSAYTVSDPTNPEQKRLRRQAAFLYAFNRGEYIGGRQYAMRNNTVDGKSMVTLNATIVMNDSYLSGESYDLFIIDRSSYDDSTDTLTTCATFIANQSNGARTYRGVYNGTKVGSAAATGTCTLDELAPTMFNTTTDRICYRGTGSTGVMKEMIQFTDNTNDDNGYGIVIGGGGPTIIGGGESARYILANPSSTYSSSNGAENMIIANDNGILFLTNLDGGASAMRRTTLDSSGNLLLNSGGIYIGANKTSMYTQSGVMLHPYGYLSLTNPSDIGTRAGIYFAYANNSGSTSYIRESGSGQIEIWPYLHVSGHITSGGSGDHYVRAYNTTTGVQIYLDAGSSGYGGLYSNGYYNGSSFVSSNKWLFYRGADGYPRMMGGVPTLSDSVPVTTSPTLSQRCAYWYCYSSTQIAVHGYWNGSNASYKYLTPSTSDPRLKENIDDCNMDALSIINQLPMHSFDWKDDKIHWDVGFVAPELYEIDANLAIKPETEEHNWGVNDFYLTGLQTKAIQELSAENKQLKAEITELKNTLNSINERLKKLEV